MVTVSQRVVGRSASRSKISRLANIGFVRASSVVAHAACWRHKGGTLTWKSDVFEYQVQQGNT
eukprot:COSAG06_NODE_4019_length_4655_cov_24.309921_2_plen_63_part_00